MRLWHKDLIDVLPRQQLLGQWRECCLIAKQIFENGKPNHILVNKIMDYPLEHFQYYALLIYKEMKKRGYNCNYSKFDKWLHIDNYNCTYKKLFSDWHNEIYLRQCYYNLEEKFMCGGINRKEWLKVKYEYIRLITE